MIPRKDTVRLRWQAGTREGALPADEAVALGSSPEAQARGAPLWSWCEPAVRHGVRVEPATCLRRGAGPPEAALEELRCFWETSWLHVVRVGEKAFRWVEWQEVDPDGDVGVQELECRRQTLVVQTRKDWARFGFSEAGWPALPETLGVVEYRGVNAPSAGELVTWRLAAGAEDGQP